MIKKVQIIWQKMGSSFFVLKMNYFWEQLYWTDNLFWTPGARPCAILKKCRLLSRNCLLCPWHTVEFNLWGALFEFRENLIVIVVEAQVPVCNLIWLGLQQFALGWCLQPCMVWDNSPPPRRSWSLQPQSTNKSILFTIQVGEIR